MSKFKREKLKEEKEKTIAEKGIKSETKSTSKVLEENGFKESVVRDTSVIAQML